MLGELHLVSMVICLYYEGLVYEIRSVYLCGKRMLGFWCGGC